MDDLKRKQLQIAACKIRMGAIEGVFNAKSGHPGGSLSAADIYAYLYFAEMNVDPTDPKMEGRDRFVLSKGHCAPGLYCLLYTSSSRATPARSKRAIRSASGDMVNFLWPRRETSPERGVSRCFAKNIYRGISKC